MRHGGRRSITGTKRRHQRKVKEKQKHRICTNNLGEQYNTKQNLFFVLLWDDTISSLDGERREEPKNMQNNRAGVVFTVGE